jgi:rhamnosyltransferase
MYFSGQRLVDADLNLLSVHSISNERSPHTMFLISNAAGCTTVFNSKLLEAVNEAEPDYVFMHDSWLVKVCLALGGSYFADPSAHISYRQHDSNVAGIKDGLKGKLRQAKRYIEVFEVQRQCKELMRCYGDRMIPEYWMLTNDIISYDEKKASKKRIMKDFDFKSGSLNAVVKLKILLKKL